jgi:hypothetical protein
LLVYSGRQDLATEAAAHRVSQPFEGLEPCAGKLARTVPRGRGTGNRLLLPGASAEAEPLAYHFLVSSHSEFACRVNLRRLKHRR